MGADVKLYAWTRIVLLGGGDLLHHGLGAAALGGEEDLDGRQGLGLLALRGVLRLAGGGQKEKNQGDGEKAVFHWGSAPFNSTAASGASPTPRRVLR